MCASYGLGGGPYDEIQRVGLLPLDLRENQVLLNQWMLEQGATAKITGRKARNFNPLIRADAAGSRELSFAWWWLWLDGRGPVKFSAFNSAMTRSCAVGHDPFSSERSCPPAGTSKRACDSSYRAPKHSRSQLSPLPSSTTRPETHSSHIRWSLANRSAKRLAPGIECL